MKEGNELEAMVGRKQCFLDTTEKLDIQTLAVVAAYTRSVKSQIRQTSKHREVWVQTKELLAIDSCWKKKNKVFPKAQVLEGVHIPMEDHTSCVYRQHKLNTLCHLKRKTLQSWCR